MLTVIDALILDGRVTLLALGVLVVEFLLLLVFLRQRLSVPAIVANSLSGICLIMALRSALVGPDARTIAIWLGLGLVAHLGDLIARLRRPSPGP